MTTRLLHAVLAGAILSAIGCAGQTTPHEPDIIDVTLPAPIDEVRTAVMKVLTDGGYEVERKDDENLTTGFREEMAGPWDWLLRWRFGTGKSRVDAMVTKAQEQRTRLRLHVMHEGKDGIFTRWEKSPTALPQSAENQLRLIKNALEIL